MRLAFAKFIVSKMMTDASDAVDRLMDEFVIPNLPPEALVDPNEFRFTRLYNQQVEAFLEAWHPFTEAVFHHLALCRPDIASHAESAAVVRLAGD